MKLIYEGRLPGMNEIVAANRASRYMGAGMKKQAEEDLRLQWSFQERRKFPGPVVVKVRFYEKDLRRDDDNVFGGLKFILDALTTAGIIRDDSPKWCHVLPERFTDRGRPRIVVEIEERESE